MTPIDISVPLDPAWTPTWPGSATLRIERRASLARGDAAEVSELGMDVHTGTHIDAPSHFLEGGGTVDEVELSVLMGPCVVASFEGLAKIRADDLEAASLPAGCERLLLKTDNPKRWGPRFDPSYVGLTLDAAEWIVARGVRLVGIDYLSVQAFDEPDAVHHTLLGARTVLLEGLDLRGAPPGAYTLVCLPLKLKGAEGAPARAVLLPSTATLS